MDNIIVNIADIIIKDGVKYRVVGYSQRTYSLCCMDTKKLIIELIDSVELIQRIEQCELDLVKNTETSHKSVDMSQWNDKQSSSYQAKLYFIEEVTKAYGPLYKRLVGKASKCEFTEAYKKAGLKKTLAWRTVISYLQSGCDIISLIDKRVFRSKGMSYKYTTKPGRPTKSSIRVGCQLTEKDIENMEQFRKVFLSGRAQTRKVAYKEMLSSCYIHLVTTPNGTCIAPLPLNMCPSYTQFYNYIRKNTSEKEISIAKTSAQEYRNNERLLLSDNLNGVSGPGSLFEVDECELDVSVVSEIDTNQTVGRPIVYAMIDIYSRMIVAVSIAFDNNSVKGITNCFLNLLDDKQEFFKEYDIHIEKDEFPSKILPLRLRSDYGSEYISYEMERIGKELGIQMEVASPGTGSLKGQIEQLFHQIHSAQNPFLESKGLIEKRHDSNHHKEATLTIHEVTAMVLATVAVHNKKYMENYPLTAKMRKDHVEPRPVELWKYGVENFGSPKVISNEDNFRFSLLLPVSASISKAGIKYNNLYYMNWNDSDLIKKMQCLKNKADKFECRIDPRNISNVYYLKDGTLMTATLNEQKTGMIDYKGMSLEEYKMLSKIKKEQDAIGRNENLMLEVGLQSRHKSIVKNATRRKTGPSNADNLQESRKVAKQNEALKHSIVPSSESIMEDNSSIVDNVKTDEVIVPVEIITDVNAAMEAFENDEWEKMNDEE